MGSDISTSLDTSTKGNTIKQASDSFTIVNSRQRSNVRVLQNVLIIWLDQTIDKENNRDCQKTITQLHRISNCIETFTDANQCINFLSEIKDEMAFIIISGSLGRKTVPQVHDMSQVHSIFIFCGNIASHEEWAKDWSKIKGIFNNMSLMCEALKESATECERNAISMSIVSTNTDCTLTNKKLNQLEPSFMYTQILKEILLSIEFEQHHFNEFIDFCLKFYIQEDEINNVEKFKREYHNETPIWWYTSDFFLYPMLNHALRVMDMDVIIRMGFFVGDLHRQLEQLHNKQFGDHQSDSTFTVFRGQGLSNVSFKEIQEKNVSHILFNNFLSTSKSRNVSMAFANRALSDKNSVGILFVMTVDPSKSTKPFASITDISYYGDKEDEVLFSMHTVFRICNIKSINGKPRLYQVELTLTNDNDEDRYVLTNSIRARTEGATGWDRLGQLLLKVGQPEKAQLVYEILLKQTTEESRKGDIYHRLGSAKYHQGKYQEAIQLYEEAIEIRQRSLSPNHSDLSMSYNNIGNVYGALGMYPKALSSHKKALEIRLQSLPPNHPDLAMSYDSIGSVSYYLGEYSEALPFHEKALQIRQQSLPSNHPDLAMSYNNIGMVYRNRGEYSKAFSFYERAVNIGQCALPSNHPHLQTYKKNLGIIKSIL
jgi:tetratricopeptide (TPR) repeat protein